MEERRDPHRGGVTRTIDHGSIREWLKKSLEILLQPTKLVWRELDTRIEKAGRSRPRHIEQRLDSADPLGGKGCVLDEHRVAQGPRSALCVRLVRDLEVDTARRGPPPARRVPIDQPSLRESPKMVRSSVRGQAQAREPCSTARGPSRRTRSKRSIRTGSASARSSATSVTTKSLTAFSRAGSIGTVPTLAMPS